jgi:hypothetical protein
MPQMHTQHIRTALRAFLTEYDSGHMSALVARRIAALNATRTGGN